MSGWDVISVPSGIHVVPYGDIIEHRLGRDCTCCPAVELVNGASQMVYRPDVNRYSLYQYVRTLVTHDAMDGRE